MRQQVGIRDDSIAKDTTNPSSQSSSTMDQTAHTTLRYRVRHLSRTTSAWSWTS